MKAKPNDSTVGPEFFEQNELCAKLSKDLPRIIDLDKGDRAQEIRVSVIWAVTYLKAFESEDEGKRLIFLENYFDNILEIPLT